MVLKSLSLKATVAAPAAPLDNAAGTARPTFSSEFNVQEHHDF
jgi:hypothetical protein